jgi:hypothetical protein|uniref:Uncharacterized protein n=1 Tax=Siphoviridae sp. ctnFV5 TaxID=2823600 RepID=A0A8S5L703_9CAUD|nr:MAG TPA: hypothetical protein [Siphoviridae sp. ctnFV5]
MKTVFKVGMKVYDQVNFPDKEGKITKIENNGLITVSFSEYGEAEYVSGGYYYEDQFPTLSTKPYKVELQGFEQKAPAPTFEEVIKEAHKKGDYYYLPDCLEAPSERLVDATMALLKLLFLRDYYNKGWRPDWSNTNVLKYVIIVSREKIEIDNTYNIKRILAFKSKEIRNKFLEEQKELLEIAKPLL